MRITRLIAGTVTAGLLGLTPIAVAAPSQAATENRTTTTTLELPYIDPASPPAYGEGLTIRGAVVDNTGATTYKGTVTLYQVTAANPAGVAIATVPAGGYLAFPEVIATESSTFRAVYSGYAATSTYEHNYAASEAVPVAVPVTRKVVLKNPKGTMLKGKITPNYGKKKIKVQKKVGKKWKKFKTFRTTSAGKFRFTLPAPRRGKWQWKITVPGDSQFATWSTIGRTYSYKLPASHRVTTFSR
jgi:hypothetical protein